MKIKILRNLNTKDIRYFIEKIFSVGCKLLTVYRTFGTIQAEYRTIFKTKY